MQIAQLVVTGRPGSPEGPALSCAVWNSACRPFHLPPLCSVLFQMDSGVPSLCCQCSGFMGTVYPSRAQGALFPQHPNAPRWDHNSVFPLLVIKKISQLPFYGCLATPIGNWRGGSGANLETKSRIWVGDMEPVLSANLAWLGQGVGAGAFSHPSVSHQ